MYKNEKIRAFNGKNKSPQSTFHPRFPHDQYVNKVYHSTLFINSHYASSLSFIYVKERSFQSVDFSMSYFFKSLKDLPLYCECIKKTALLILFSPFQNRNRHKKYRGAVRFNHWVHTSQNSCFQGIFFIFFSLSLAFYVRSGNLTGS